ncbi:ribosomal maturation YjgA family protein [Brumimicrobium mesophilum]|uniref:ribosomal maturation YjgA family protein n=1 Tax=Brumimicrobium mesophilum TaxID=392717 RepID=UPI0018FE2E22|nr:DUF2809 domain-containing protein [Brumimicrobium mesophilum]
MLGLFSRTEFVPKIVYPYLGDYFYAIMIFVIVGFLFNKTTSLKVAIASILICYGIEILQLYQADWINEIRSHRLGALVLGSGFLWSDLVCYTLGGTTGYVLERLFFRKKWLKSKH